MMKNRISIDACTIPSNEIVASAQLLISELLRYKKYLYKPTIEILLVEYLRNLSKRERINEILKESNYFSFPANDIGKALEQFLIKLGIPGSPGQYNIYSLIQTYIQDDDLNLKIEGVLRDNNIKINFDSDVLIPSENLVEILLLSNFVEKTKSMKPEHWNAIINNGYDPTAHKRYFSYGQIDFYLDYISIDIFIRPSGIFHRENIKNTELASILYFANSKNKELLRKKVGAFNIISLYDYYQSVTNYQTSNTNARTSFIKHKTGLEAMLTTIENMQSGD